jgi:Flp pilus assembly protein TadG
MAIHKENFKSLQKGAVLVEFAIVVPFLLLLAVGIVEFSFVYYHLNILNKSVQDGARYFSNPDIARYNGSLASLSYPINVTTAISSTTNGAYVLKMQNLIIYGNTATGTTNTQLLPGTARVPTVYCAEENKTNSLCATTTHHIRVTANYDHYFILGDVLNNFTGLGLSNPFTLTATSVMRVE